MRHTALTHTSAGSCFAHHLPGWLLTVMLQEGAQHIIYTTCSALADRALLVVQQSHLEGSVTARTMGDFGVAAALAAAAAAARAALVRPPVSRNMSASLRQGLQLTAAHRPQRSRFGWRTLSKAAA